MDKAEREVKDAHNKYVAYLTEWQERTGKLLTELLTNGKT